MIFYYNNCSTCKNYSLKAVLNAAVSLKTEVDERYVGALPKVWGEEAKILMEETGVEMPFLYDEVNNRVFALRKEEPENTEEGWKQKRDDMKNVVAFWKESLDVSTEQN